MTPVIEFKYSDVYDKHWLEYFKLLKLDSNYPSKQDIFGRIEEAETYWKNNGAKILESISKQSGLEWKSEKIIVYLVGKAVPFSSPLTMSVWLNKMQDKTLRSWINVLTHEIIHNILVDNSWGKMMNLKNYLESLGDIAKKTYVHIPVHAIHSLVYKDVFTDEDFLADIENTKNIDKDYFDAWSVVLEKGDKNIVEMFN
ncbi:MAG: hypothetical protein ABI721_04210 [Candidatus Dojkabacteria bacterium]